MSASSALRIFLTSLVLLPAGFAAIYLWGPEWLVPVAYQYLFGPTVLLEIVILILAIRVRGHFRTAEPARLVWTLVVAYFSLLVLAELRLSLIYLGWETGFTADSPALSVFFYDVLRYLYIGADLLFIGALIVNIRNFKSTGLPFSVQPLDYGYIVLFLAMPFASLLLHEDMALDTVFGTDRALQIFRIISVSTNTLIACLCIVVRRYSLQMGGGLLAGVWNAIVWAGIASAASYLVLAVLSVHWAEGAEFYEQYFLWIYAGCWILGIFRQRELFIGLSG